MIFASCQLFPGWHWVKIAPSNAINILMSKNKIRISCFELRCSRALWGSLVLLLSSVCSHTPPCFTAQCDPQTCRAARKEPCSAQLGNTGSVWNGLDFTLPRGLHEALVVQLARRELPWDARGVVGRWGCGSEPACLQERGLSQECEVSVFTCAGDRWPGTAAAGTEPAVV